MLINSLYIVPKIIGKLQNVIIRMLKIQVFLVPLAIHKTLTVDGNSFQMKIEILL